MRTLFFFFVRMLLSLLFFSVTASYLIISLLVFLPNMTSIFSHPAYAHLTDSRTQQWIDPEQNVKIQFIYEPEKPLPETPTELKFSVQNLKTGEHLKELFAKVVVLNTQGYSKLNNIAISNGDFSVNSTFPIEGTYQVILRINSKDYGIALASFKIFVPFQPIGTVNLKYVTPLILPAGVIGVISIIAIVALLIASKRKFKSCIRQR
jgi:hypothetical protein